MKNLFTYKNNIASGLKRYGKFLLLAISLLFLSNTAWAAAPTEMWLLYDITNGDDSWQSQSMKWGQMTKLSDTQWRIELTLNNKNNNFYFATDDSKDKLISSNINIIVTDKPSCVTNTSTGDYSGKMKLFLGTNGNNANCKIAFTVNYEEGNNDPYQISLVAGCEDAPPTVTTGTMTLNANNQPQISGNNLISLGSTCDISGLSYVAKGVEITTNKSANTHDRYTEVTDGMTGGNLGEYEITSRIGLNPSTTYYYRAYAINNKTGDGFGEWKSFNLSIPGTPPSIRIGKQPVVSNLTDVAMNFQIADWGCTTVNTIKVYYTRTDTGIPNNTAPTTESYDGLWEFTTNINDNNNITIDNSDLPSGNYNIKAVACNASGCGEVLSDMASFTIQACEKPAQPNVQKTDRKSCSDLLVAFNIAVGNNALITINEGTETTTVAPQDGQAYTAAVAPAGITIQKITYKGDIAETTINGLDGHKQYTVTCYQYVEATHCYSAPVTYVIEKVAPEIEVAVTDITLSTAIANIKVKNTLGVLDYLTLKWYLNGVAQSNSPNLKDAPDSDGKISYTIENLFEDKTYQLDVYALNNYGCETTTERVEFTTATCPKLTQYNVTGVNTIGKVQATITMASSQTDAIYQLFIGDTPIDGSVQEGTGEALTWQVNQTGLYYVKGWFKEAPDYCANGATIMGEYDLNCTQAPTPVISIDKNTICSNGNATISVKAVEGVTYQLYKDGDLVSDKNITKDGEFTGITEAGSYTVVATTKDICQATATSQIVTLTVIDASASVTINSTTDTTTPWVPVNFTVTSTAGAPYTLVYKDAAGKVVTNQMVVVKKGNSYSLKIPRPKDWLPGNSKDPVDTTTYTVEASLEGQASCGSTSTLTITLNDTFEICE